MDENRPHKKTKPERVPATILSDFNFSTCTTIDDIFQFIDCESVDFDELAKDIRSGVIEIQHDRILIALGNQAAMDNFTHVVAPIMALINAIIDRYGCMRVKIWVANILPRPGADMNVVKIMIKQNTAIKKAIAGMVRRKKYPVQHIISHKWFLKRVKNDDGTLDLEVDGMYFVKGTIHLNKHGLEHLYLLLAKQMQLWNVQYEWDSVPIVIRRKSKRKVLQPIQQVEQQDQVERQ